MWVDMLTKPKQGTPFRTDRSMLMNVDINYDDELEKKQHRPPFVTESRQGTTIYSYKFDNWTDWIHQDDQSPQECVVNHQTQSEVWSFPY